MDKPKVVKLSQPGFDVKTASDENLIYNSKWPLLKIYKYGTFSSTNFESGPQTVLEHNLGYVPAFWIFANTDISGWGYTTGALDKRSEYNGPIQSGASINENKLIWDVIGHNDGIIKFEYYIFALDITQLYQAPIIKLGTQTAGGGADKVFKIAKPGKDISSNSLEDYVIHSGARSPLIHAVVPGVTAPGPDYLAGNGFTFYHNLGYIPIIFAYVANTFVTTVGYYGLVPASAGGAAGFRIDDQKIVYTNFQEGVKLSLVVLKDPFLIDNIVSVNI